MATLKDRLSAMERAGDDNELVILNPRWYDYEGPLNEAEFEAENDSRVLAAEEAERAGGPRIIRIPPARSFD